MNISQAEISRDIEISCRKREMSQNVLWEGNVSLEYRDACQPCERDCGSLQGLMGKTEKRFTEESVFTHVTSVYANLLEQKKAFT